MVSRENKLELCTLERCIGNVGTHLPHVVDVNWRLDFVVDTASLDKKNTLQYTIRLKTECGERPYETFVCSESQLEDLVYKLKEIVRHCEVVSS